MIGAHSGRVLGAWQSVLFARGSVERKKRKRKGEISIIQRDEYYDGDPLDVSLVLVAVLCMSSGFSAFGLSVAVFHGEPECVPREKMLQVINVTKLTSLRNPITTMANGLA